jgi:Ca2+-binding RTX toxin-like protein
MRFTLRFLTISLIAFIIITTLTAVAATNTVPSTRIDNQMISYQINHLRPSACAGLTLTTLVTGSGVFSGTEGNDLILGSSGADTIYGLGGNDCIVGGGGDDTIDGGDGNDVCLGGPGNDIFIACEGEVQ